MNRSQYSVVVEDKPPEKGFIYAIVVEDKEEKDEDNEEEKAQDSKPNLWRIFQSANAARAWLLRTIWEYTGQELTSKGPYSFHATFLKPSASFITYLPTREAETLIYGAPLEKPL